MKEFEAEDGGPPCWGRRGCGILSILSQNLLVDDEEDAMVVSVKEW